MWKKVLLIVVIVLIVGYALFQIGYVATSRPSFCARCHEVQPYVPSWQASPHKNVTCLDCHQPRGELGKLHAKARGLNYVFQHLSGNYTVPTQAIIFEGNCIACHLGDMKSHPEAVKLANSPKIDHYESIKNSETCIKCHRNTGHDTDILLNKDFTKTWK
ncbi:MAG: NapC/NirT family cytochrome c [Bacillota bacterium]|nr:NapC/NirT family cytochrome c [Bacillota bacterium]